MPAYRLAPACKDYLWGGHRILRERFGVESTLDPLAEAWVLSCHPDGPSVIASGPYAGWTLPDYLAEAGPAVLGTSCARFAEFPLLVKLIDASRDLSVQVHPTDEYAMAHEGQFGKTEMELILAAKPGAFFYYGFEEEITREEFARSIADGTLTRHLHKAFVKPGDLLFIPAGTIHAVGAGMVIAEVQQNSNVTYRVFDYGRTGPDGVPRPLHIDKALDVTHRGPVPPLNFGGHLGRCSCFTADLRTGPFSGMCGPDSFHALLVIEGEGTLACGGGRQAFRPGSCFFLPAGSGEYLVDSACKVLSILVEPPMENTEKM